MNNLRLVICFLGVTLLASLVLITWLLTNDKNVPDVFVATASGALGALASLLVPSRTAE